MKPKRPSTSPIVGCDPVLVALFRKTGVSYEQGVRELAEKIQEMGTQLRAERQGQVADEEPAAISNPIH